MITIHTAVAQKYTRINIHTGYFRNGFLGGTWYAVELIDSEGYTVRKGEMQNIGASLRSICLRMVHSVVESGNKDSTTDDSASVIDTDREDE